MGEFLMPSLGADMESGVLLEWLVGPGSEVRRGDLMAVVDTDKAAVEIETFASGVVGELLAEPGQRVAVGEPLATILDGAAAPATTPSSAPAAPPLSPAPVLAPVAPVAAGASNSVASPPVRHHAAELGVDLSTVLGTGRNGAVTRADVDRSAAAGAAAAPVPTTPRGGKVSPYARRLAAERGVDLDQVVAEAGNRPVRAADVLAAHPDTATVDAAVRKAPAKAPAKAPVTAPVTAPTTAAASASSRSGSRATIAALMSRAKREIPHYYVATTVDMDTVTGWLRRRNREVPVAERVVPAAALLKATAVALKDFPQLNGFWVGEEFVSGDDVHLGVAVSVRGGALVAPAIHAAADLALPELMASLRDLVKRARAGRLTRAELADPTFTVTDLGDQGVEEVIGVIYPPQVALLGVGRMVERPWAVDGRLGVSPLVRLTLSGDHRATDGYTGARFLATIDRLLQQPEEL